jgi:hypothetical protein
MLNTSHRLEIKKCKQNFGGETWIAKGMVPYSFRLNYRENGCGDSNYGTKKWLGIISGDGFCINGTKSYGSVTKSKLILARKQTILTEVFRSFPQYIQENSAIVSTRAPLLPHPSQFINPIIQTVYGLSYWGCR